MLSFGRVWCYSQVLTRACPAHCSKNVLCAACWAPTLVLDTQPLISELCKLLLIVPFLSLFKQTMIFGNFNAAETKLLLNLQINNSPFQIPFSSACVLLNGLSICLSNSCSSERIQEVTLFLYSRSGEGKVDMAALFVPILQRKDRLWFPMDPFASFLGHETAN